MRKCPNQFFINPRNNYKDISSYSMTDFRNLWKKIQKIYQSILFISQLVCFKFMKKVLEKFIEDFFSRNRFLSSQRVLCRKNSSN